MTTPNETTPSQMTPNETPHTIATTLATTLATTACDPVPEPAGQGAAHDDGPPVAGDVRLPAGQGSTRRRVHREDTHPATPANPVSAGNVARSGTLVRAGGASTRAQEEYLRRQLALVARLTVRDRWLLRMLLEHRVLTSNQISQLAFGAQRMATQRLGTLYELGVVNRFRPHTARGSAPIHHILSPAGAELLAAIYDTTVADLGYRPERLSALAVSLHLAHDVGANSIFTTLVEHSRVHPDTRLAAWWSERRCLDAWAGVIRPDGYGRWQTKTSGRVREVDFFLEYDTGSENLKRVVGKLDRYAALAAASGLSSLILFWLPNPDREANLRRLIIDWQHANAARPGPPLPIATAAPTTARPDPRVSTAADAVWLPIPPAATSGRRALQQPAVLRTLGDLYEVLHENPAHEVLDSGTDTQMDTESDTEMDAEVDAGMDGEMGAEMEIGMAPDPCPPFLADEATSKTGVGDDGGIAFGRPPGGRA